MDGLLTEVLTLTQGSAATGIVAVGGTVVPVEDLTPFASDGGRVAIAGVIHDYIGVDETTVDAEGSGGAIVLDDDAPLTVDVAEFDPVDLLIGDEPITDYYAIVDRVDDAPGEPVWVPLETREERIAWPVQVYDPPLPVTLPPDQSAILLSTGVVPRIDGSVIDPATLPTPQVQSFSVDAPPVDTTGYDEGHAWWQVVNDAVVGFWRLVGGVWMPQTITTVEALRASNVLVDALNGETITGTRLIGGSLEVGQITIDPDNGIKIPLETGGLIQFPADGSEAQITAKLTAHELTVEDLLRILGENNYIEGVLFAQSGVTAPTAQPRASASWTHLGVSWTLENTPTGTKAGLVKAADGSWVTSRGANRVAQYSSGGTWLDDGPSEGTARYPGGVTKVGSHYYFLHSPDTSHVWIYKYDLSLNYVSRWSFDKPMSLDYDPVIGTDGTNIVIAQVHPAGGDMRAYRFTTSGSEVGSFTSLGTWNVSPTGVYWGSADFGGTRIVMSAATSSTIRVYNTSGVRQTAEEWKRANGDRVDGLWWDGASWYSITQGGSIYQYSPLATDTARSLTWTKFDSGDDGSGTAETMPSPSLSWTQKAREWMRVDVDPPGDTGEADDPDSVRIYVDNNRQPDLGSGVISAVYGIPAASGLTAPTSNGFATRPGTGLGRFASETGGFNVDGKSDGSVGTGTFRDSVRSAVAPYRCKISRSANQTLTTSTFAVVAFNIEDHDPADINNSGVLTIPAGAGGVYALTSTVAFANSASGARRILRLNKNSTDATVNNVAQMTMPPFATGDVYVTVVWEGVLVAGDVLRVWAWHDAGANLALNAASGMPWLSLRWVGA